MLYKHYIDVVVTSEKKDEDDVLTTSVLKSLKLREGDQWNWWKKEGRCYV